jgi:hypothetical protein
MPRFFFNLKGESQVYDDHVGSDFASLELAEFAALRAASLILDQAKNVEEVSQHFFEIANERGECQVVIPLRSILCEKAT